MARTAPDRRTHALPAAAVAVLLLGALTACGDGASSLEPGESAAGPGGVTGTAVEVRVPSGTITVTVGAPVEQITSGSRELTAPDGGALVPVSWSLERYQTSGVTGFDAETELAVLVGDDATPLSTITDAATPATDSRVVAIDGTAAVDGVSATYDGLEQVLGLDGSRDAGVAEELYAPAADGEPQDCSQGWEGSPGTDLDLTCTVRAWTLPYLPGVGWSDEGSTHVVVAPDLTLSTVTDPGGADYRASFAEGTARVAGADVEGAPFEEGLGGAGSFSVRLEATDVDLPVTWDVEAGFDLRSRVGRGPLDGRRVVLTGGGTVAGG